MNSRNGKKEDSRRGQTRATESRKWPDPIHDKEILVLEGCRPD